MSKAKSKNKGDKVITAEEFDQMVDAGEDISEYIDIDTAEKFVQVSFPLWMLAAIDKEANKLGIARQAMIKVWLNEKLEKIKDREKSEAGRKAV